MNKLNNQIGIPDFLTWIEVALTNALHTPEALALLSVYGYDEARLQEGISLLQTALSLQARQQQLYGKQYAATQALHQAWRIADSQYYTVHRRLARLALAGDPERQNALGLNHRKPQSFGTWRNRVLMFYNNSLADAGILEAFAEFNVTRENLEQGLAQVQQVAELKSIQEREKSNAQKATKERDAILDQLSRWVARFREVARIALASSPQHLESLQLGSVA